MLEMEFPVKYYENNMFFTQDGECWAYYRLAGYVYDYLTDEEKQLRFNKLESFFSQIGVKTHSLMLPKFQSIDEIHKRSKEKMRGPLKEAAMKHSDESKEIISKFIGAEASDYQYYIGLQLPEKQKSAQLENLFGNIKETLNDILVRFGVDHPDLESEVLERYARSEIQFYKQISNWFVCERVNDEETQWLIRRNFYRGIGRPPEIKNFKPKAHEYEKNKKKYKRANTREILRLTEGLVDTKTEPRKAILKQNVNGEEKEGHTAFLTISYFPEEIETLDNEWLYAFQLLDFPVEVSLRTETIDYRTVLGMVRKEKKKIDDQVDHADESNSEASHEVLENQILSRELESRTQSTKKPIIKSSIVICIYGKDDDELTTRIRAVNDLYGDMQIYLEQPYMDQWQLFNEFLPGGKVYVPDYTQYWEPGILAASMFGATQQIGDGQGFFIGTHGLLNRPVYIDPALATQSVKGSKTRSPSSIFIGPPGGGKSFNANYITYLSVLSGARALVIDPKGERGDWDKDLKDMKGHINIITLSGDEENQGRLDPFTICNDLGDVELLASNIVSFLCNISGSDHRLTYVSEAIQEAHYTRRCMDEVIRLLVENPETEAQKIGRHLRRYQKLSFAKLLIGDGENAHPISLENALNVLQVQNLRMPSDSKSVEKYNTSELLSMALMMAIGEFAQNFIKVDNSIFKIVFFDEAWFMLKTEIGQDIIDRLIREGRYQKAAVFLATHNVEDLPEKIQSNIGIRYVFQNQSVNEVKNVLKFLGLSESKGNIETVQNLEPEVGECLYQDIYKRTGKINFNVLFKDLEKAFDTRPPESAAESEEESMEDESKINLEKERQLVNT